MQSNGANSLSSNIGIGMAKEFDHRVANIGREALCLDFSNTNHGTVQFVKVTGSKAIPDLVPLFGWSHDAVSAT